MPMNQIIQARRKALGLTQEQVAEHLGVSTPAVSKWETGASCPDLPLLPPLARLLNIDLNTLFCFQQELSPEEIGQFCQTLVQQGQSAGISAAFASGEQKLREYPHCEPLMQNIAMTLDGLLNACGLSIEDRDALDRKLDSWYEILSQSEDAGICNCGSYMLASRTLRRGDLERTQAILDRMPDRETMLQSVADKQFLQVEVHLQGHNTDQAAAELELMLLNTVNKVHLILCKLVHAELSAGQPEIAAQIADKAHEAAKLFDLQAYTAWVAPFTAASEQKQAGLCLQYIKNMLRDIRAPWDIAASALFHRLEGKMHSVNTEQLYEALRQDLEHNPAYEFLRQKTGFRDLFVP